MAGQGYESLALIQWSKKRRSALDAGWPAGTTPREAEALALLRDRGPLTLPEIAVALGLAYKPTNCHASRWLRCLARRGHVVKTQGGRGPGGGKGLAHAVYALHPSLRYPNDAE